MLYRPFSIPALVIGLALYASAAFAAPVDRESADRVVANWVLQLSRDYAAWPDDEPTTTYYDLLIRDGTPLAYLYAVEPAGYVMVPLRDEFAAVTAYSQTTVLADREPGGFFDMVGEDLRGRFTVIASKSVSRHPSWTMLDVPTDRFTQEDAAEDVSGQVGPLLTSAWQQDWPFNTLCPMGLGGRTYVGCTALATAQLLYYYRWPLRGEGSRSYWWSGDDACGGTAGATLAASFVEPYAWNRMTPVVNYLSPAETQAAVADFCYDVAVACQTDFSRCGSSASLSQALNALITHFRFRSSAREQMRFRFSDSAWFQMLRAELDAGRPALYSTIVHTMVVDGWRESLDLDQIHINYGWAGDSDDWYSLDSIETSYNPQTERVIIGLEPDTDTPMTVSRFEVSRLGAAARLAWRVEGVLDAAGFHVWRGDDAASRVCLTVNPLTGSGDYVWIDTSAPLDETLYWLQEQVVGAPSTWAGPVRLVSMDEIINRPFVMDGANPFNPRAVLRYALQTAGHVDVSIYDLAGRRIAVLVDGELQPGEHRAVWDGRDEGGRHVPSGIYLAHLRAGGERRTLRLTLAR